MGCWGSNSGDHVRDKRPPRCALAPTLLVLVFECVPEAMPATNTRAFLTSLRGLPPSQPLDTVLSCPVNKH